MLRFSDLPPDRDRAARGVARVARPRRSSPAISSSALLLGIADHVFGKVLAIERRGLELLVRYADVTALPASELSMRSDEDYDDGDYSMLDGIACIAVRGVLFKTRSPLTDYFSITTYEGIRAKITHALANPAVRGILLDCDSPGGESSGCADLSDFIFSARGQGKPIHAISNDACYSACYWIASAADRVYVTGDGGCGSVGCYMLHLDRSGLDEQIGLKFSYIFSGDQKVDANPHEPLSNRARDTLQAEVDRVRDNFVACVARNRNVVAARIYETEASVRFASACLPLLADQIASRDESMLRLRIAAGLRLTPGAPQSNKSVTITTSRAIAAPAASVTPRLLPARRLSNLDTPSASAMVSAAVARMALSPPPTYAVSTGETPLAVVRASAANVKLTSSRNVRLLVAPYNSPSSDMGGFREVYAPGCFAAGLGEDIIALLNHDERWLLGRKSAGNVNCYDSPEGLRCDLTLPDDVSYADDVWQLLQTGIIKASSAGFWLVRSHNEVRAGEKIRVIERALLREIALVAVPAYPQATAQPAANHSLQMAAARLRLLKAGG